METHGATVHSPGGGGAPLDGLYFLLQAAETAAPATAAPEPTDAKKSAVDGSAFSSARSGAAPSTRFVPRTGTTEAFEKWVLEHADHPYPTNELLHNFADTWGAPFVYVSEWFRNMRKRKYLPLARGKRAPHGAFETALVGLIPAAARERAGEEYKGRRRAVPQLPVSHQAAAAPETAAPAREAPARAADVAVPRRPAPLVVHALLARGPVDEPAVAVEPVAAEPAIQASVEPFPKPAGVPPLVALSGPPPAPDSRTRGVLDRLAALAPAPAPAPFKIKVPFKRPAPGAAPADDAEPAAAAAEAPTVADETAVAARSARPKKDPGLAASKALKADNRRATQVYSEDDLWAPRKRRAVAASADEASRSADI